MTTRREFLTVSLAATSAALAPRLAGAAGKATTKTLTTVRESSFIKAFDDFFVKTLAPEYEKLTGIKVGYEAVSVGGMLTRLTTMAETKSGPEITGTGLNWPYLFDNVLVDVSDVAGTRIVRLDRRCAMRFLPILWAARHDRESLKVLIARRVLSIVPSATTTAL